MRETAILERPLAADVGEGCEPTHRVLFVCTGNTCRSPMAAALLNHLFASRESCGVCSDKQGHARYTAVSAGLYALEGDPITPAAVRALREAGIASTPSNPYEAHRAHAVRAADIEQADSVVAITSAHAMELMLRFPDAAMKIRTLPMDIADPFGGSDEDYRTCLAQLRYALRAIFSVEDGTL